MCCSNCVLFSVCIWWRHQMEILSALLVLCEWNPPATGGFPSQMPVTRSFDVFFRMRLNKRLNKQSMCWSFETLWRSLWRHCHGLGVQQHPFVFTPFFRIIEILMFNTVFMSDGGRFGLAAVTPVKYEHVIGRNLHVNVQIPEISRTRY